MIQEKNPRPVKSAPPDKNDAPVDIIANAGPALTIKLKDFIDRVVLISGGKKPGVKPVVEATLRVLGDALEAGESMVLPPLGRIKVNRTKDTGSGAMLTVKLKRTGAAKTAKPDADAGIAADGE